jgi:PAS domain S-box-containing protein
MDFRVVDAAGTIHWVRSQATALLDRQGRPARLTGINVDVTPQHLLEDELRARAETLAAEVQERTRERNKMFELSSDLFAVAGFDGYLKTINPAWSRLLGYAEEELLATPFITLIHPDDHAGAAAVIAQLREGSIVRFFEDRLFTKSGDTVAIAWAAVPDGDRFYAVGRDVTREREREEALRQAQKMEAVGQLTGGIAHDFNNLLGAVLGGFDLIRRRPDDAERVRRLAENGIAAAERGAKLTGQLLAFSRAQRIETCAVVVTEVVEGMRELLAGTLGPQIRLRFGLEDGRRAVLSDPVQLEMAVLNLAINARDVMPDGGELGIRTALRRIEGDAELATGDYVELSVSDTGLGMPPEVAARAFDPFFTTKGVGKGTGLGLSQVYGIARQAGGAARIRSLPGQGTTVSLLLPVTDAPRIATGPAPGEDSTTADATATVLVIDDDEDLRRMLAESLDSLGYRALAAADGREGLDLLAGETPDLVVIDFAMPGMNGAEVAEAIRASHPDLPILFASGYADTAAIERAAGPDARMLRKPFGLAELQAAVRTALDGI